MMVSCESIQKARCLLSQKVRCYCVGNISSNMLDALLKLIFEKVGTINNVIAYGSGYIEAGLLVSLDMDLALLPTLPTTNDGNPRSMPVYLLLPLIPNPS